MQQLFKKVHPYLPHIAWVIAILSTLISLSLSEVLHWAPCVLCWYQRILMYPLSAIFAIGVVYKDKFVWRYTLPLTILGAGIAAFHTLLQWRIIPDALAPCVTGVSCTTVHMNWFGFVNIPLLSFISFSGLTILMLAYAWGNKHE